MTGLYASSPKYKEASSKQSKEICDDISQYKIGHLVMIKTFDKKSNWDAKCIPNFRIVRLIGPGQLEVSDLTGRIRKVNNCDVHKIWLSDYIVSSIQDEEVFRRKGKYINDSCILEDVVIIDMLLHENFLHVKIRHT